MRAPSAGNIQREPSRERASGDWALVNAPSAINAKAPVTSNSGSAESHSNRPLNIRLATPARS